MVALPGERIFFRGHPSWRSMVSFHVKGSVASLAAGVIAGLGSAVADGHVQLAWVIAAVAVVFGLSLGIGRLRRQRLTYAITDRRLLIETGLFSRRLHQAGLERIQNVVARQSALGRVLRVGSVEFDTAADVDMDFSFEGVHNPRGMVRMVDDARYDLIAEPARFWARA